MFKRNEVIEVHNNAARKMTRAAALAYELDSMLSNSGRTPRAISVTPEMIQKVITELLAEVRA